MLHKIDKEHGYKYTFIVKSNWVDKITCYDIKLENDAYKKYDSTINNLEGELIVCSDLTKIDGFCKKIVTETYEEYLDTIAKRDFKKEQWVYNILDSNVEQEKILYRDEFMVICPNYTWDGSDLTKMHLLTFPTDKLLHTIRDLTGNHIELLESIKEKTLEIIKLNYGFDKELIKMYLHYAPTTYHLHVHFNLISNVDTNSSVEYSHDLSNIIANLSLNSNYYQIIIMNKRI